MDIQLRDDFLNYVDEELKQVDVRATDATRHLLALSLQTQLVERRGRWRNANRTEEEFIRAGRRLLRHILTTDAEIQAEIALHNEIRFNNMLRALVTNGLHVFPCSPND